MKASAFLAAAALACVALLSPGEAQAQATRTWVSGVGDDANPCSRTAPCKTFAGAISKTAAGGEIDCLDPGGFGTVTITKSMTIDCGAANVGSILASGTNGINVPTAGVVVILRNLGINGTGTGLIGINITNAALVHLDNVNVMNFNAGSATGLNFAPGTAGVAVLEVNNSYFTDNGIPASTGGGIVINPAAGVTAAGVISNTRIENNSNGINANATSGGILLAVAGSTISDNKGTGILSGGGSPTVKVADSTITDNATGVSNNIQSFGNNAIGGNGGGETPSSAGGLK